MYIEQAKKLKTHPVLFLILPLAFIGLLAVNAVFSSGKDTNEVIRLFIERFGVNATFVFIIAPLSFGLLLVLFWSKVVMNQSITSLTTSRKKIDWKRIFLSFSVWGLISVLMIAITLYFEPENLKWNFNPEKFFIFLVLALILIPMQTSFEEYLFRGHLMQGLGLLTNSRLIPLVVSSVIFGLMHIANPEVEKLGMIIMVYYIGTGFFLGIITLMDEGLELALGFHAANNLIGALLVTADWTAFQTHSIFKDVSEPSSGFEIVLPIFIFFPLLLFIFKKVYKWNNWKEKLTGALQKTD